MSAAIAPRTFASSTLPSFESATPLNTVIVDEDRFVREACRKALLLSDTAPWRVNPHSRRLR
jgi:hypothetical protein